jgi:enolase
VARLEPAGGVDRGPNPRVLSVAMMNILTGGAHADNNVDIQEHVFI